MNSKVQATDVTGKVLYVGSKVVCLSADEGRLVDATVIKLFPNHATVRRNPPNESVEFDVGYDNMVVNGYEPS